MDYYKINDVTKKLNNVMIRYEYEYRENSDLPYALNLDTFYNIVKNKGKLDLKNQPDWQNEQFIYNKQVIDKDVPGNISYGYFGKVMNIPDKILTAGAGYAQIKAGTFKKEWINSKNFGDDPRDTKRILQGI